jgi:AraC-like DNA-binding protein
MWMQFSTDDLPAHDRLERWVELWRGMIARRMFSVTEGNRPDLTNGRVQLQAHCVGPFTLARVHSTAHQSLRRTRADVAADSTVKYGVIKYPTDWEQSTKLTHARGDEMHVAGGDLVICSTEWQFEIACSAGLAPTMLMIPAERMSPLLVGGRLTGPIKVPAQSPLGALLGAGFAAASEQLPRLSPELGEAALQNVCGLAALACNASADAREEAAQSVREVRLAAARRHVERHLADPALGPTQTATTLGISVRQLHLVFEPTGESFSRYVLRRRLDACRTALASPAESGRSVVDIAYGWGFDSLSTFYRAFRDAFGVAPGDLRGVAQYGND